MSTVNMTRDGTNTEGAFGNVFYAWSYSAAQASLKESQIYRSSELTFIQNDDLHYSHDSHMDVKQVDEWRNRGSFSSQTLVLTTNRSLTLKLSGYSFQERMLPSEDKHISACCG